MKWLFWALWDPVAALDLVGGDGKVDHGKIIGFFTYLTMFCLMFLYVVGVGELLPLGHTIALISTAYGWAGWRTFLKAKTATATEKIVHEEKAVREEKDITFRETTEPNLWVDNERG